jgi:hypothetical protein
MSRGYYRLVTNLIPGMNMEIHTGRTETGGDIPLTGLSAPVKGVTTVTSAEQVSSAAETRFADLVTPGDVTLVVHPCLL